MCGRFGLRGMGPAPARKLGGGSAFALRARGGCDRFQRGLRTHPAPLAYFWLGMGPAPARKLGGGSAFALCTRGEGDRFQRGLRTHPAAALGLSTWTSREGTRCRVWSVGMASAGWVLRPTGSSGEDRLSRCARGKGVIASNAGYGPIPLPPWGCRHGHRGRGLAAVCGWLAWAPRDGSCARQEARGRIGFRAAREGEGVIASNAGYGPIPLPPWGCRHGHRERGLAAVCVVGWHGLRGTGPAPDRKLGGGSAFALCARGEGDRFQRGLRTHPAAALGLSTWTRREGTR